MVAANTASWVAPIAAAGATRFILQLESFSNNNANNGNANDNDDNIRTSTSTTSDGYVSSTMSTVTRNNILKTAHLIRQSGMACGICIKPSTPISTIESLLLESWTDGSPLFELVDILAVNPGFAGQKFNPEVLEKVKYLVSTPSLRKAVKYVAVDGGINESTIQEAVAAGANIIVAGSAAFGPNRCVSQGYKPVLERVQKLVHLIQD